MTPASRQFVILNALETEGAPMNLRQLGEKTGWDHTTLNVELSRLLDAGVVARERVVAVTAAKKPAFEWRIA